MQEACCRPQSRPWGLHLCPLFHYLLCWNTDKNLEIKVIGVMRGLEEEAGHYIQQHVDEEIFTAITKWSCAVKLLASCPMPFPLWFAVWRLTAGLFNRPPPCMPGFQHFFSLPAYLFSVTALRDNICHCDWDHWCFHGQKMMNSSTQRH